MLSVNNGFGLRFLGACKGRREFYASYNIVVPSLLLLLYLVPLCLVRPSHPKRADGNGPDPTTLVRRHPGPGKTGRGGVDEQSGP